MNSDNLPSDRFAAFVAIDWSGAKGSRHKGIAIAEARGTDAPRLIEPGRIWSRQDVLDWLLDRAKQEPTLFGFDFSFAPPFAARGAYLPGELNVPADAKAFWTYVDARSGDEDLGAASFLELAHRRHFYFGIADGVKADFVHHRACEAAFNARGGGKASSVYDAIGAAQVAKASFAGMRLLHRLSGQLPVWPFEEISPGGSGIVEIYTRVFLKAARTSGRKLRSAEALDAALASLGSPPARIEGSLSDHQTDALIAAAGMRVLAADSAAFSPSGLTPAIARTEGWTFGVV